MEHEMSCPSVLVVEDEPIVAMDLARLALDAGYELCGTAASGLEALAIAESRPPDVVLVDNRLIGRMTGLDVAERLYREFGTLSVFITADAPALKLRPPDFPHLAILPKPFPRDRLDEILASARGQSAGDTEPADALP
jgi:CheY-like chemotaxis protein